MTKSPLLVAAGCCLLALGARSNPEPRLAFASKRDGTWQIYTSLADGSRLTRVTSTAAARWPVWSPDAKRILFASQPTTVAPWELWVMGADGSNPVRLTTHIVPKSPRSWSPDGQRILFESKRDGTNGIYAIRPDGSGLTRLTSDTAYFQSPAWSPDGSRIAYVSTPQKEGATNAHFSFEVWVIGADGSNPTRIFAGKCCIGDWDGPIWSPNGERVAFFDDVDVSYGTWLAMNADGTGEPDQITEVEAKSWGRQGIPTG
jgi:TolB protein